MIRTIYKIEKITDDGQLVFRRYAANKKTAQRITIRNGGGYITPVLKRDFQYIAPEWIERI